MLLSIIAHNAQASILAVTETWLTEDRCNDVSIPDYNFVSKCRNGRNRWSGFFIRDAIVLTLFRTSGLIWDLKVF